MCGEHHMVSSSFSSRSGSSPRVRGTLALSRNAVPSPGIIPACAGNTVAAVRGVCELGGSSPRVRGTRSGRRLPVHRRGIIPACAGNTRPSASRAESVRDHPRVCGEHSSDLMADCSMLGSSPRVRGTPKLENSGIFRVGIIPACAGNTRAQYTDMRMHGDHPRVCGEHDATDFQRTKAQGSSPRVRGTLRR